MVWKNSAMTIAMTPRISSTTPVLLTMVISRIPMLLITVVMTSRITPRMTAFCAPVGEVGEEFAPDPPTI